jgi:hypothetical protein
MSGRAANLKDGFGFAPPVRPPHVEMVAFGALLLPSITAIMPHFSHYLKADRAVRPVKIIICGAV